VKVNAFVKNAPEKDIKYQEVEINPKNTDLVIK
jgi:hypothetical protein